MGQVVSSQAYLDHQSETVSLSSETVVQDQPVNTDGWKQEGKNQPETVVKIWPFNLNTLLYIGKQSKGFRGSIDISGCNLRLSTVKYSLGMPECHCLRILWSKMSNWSWINYTDT